MPKPKMHKVFQQGERWDEFSETWPTSGTMRNGRLYPPRQSEHRTSESESLSLLPTPTTQDGANCAGPAQFRRNSWPLNVVAVLLPTPSASDGIGGGPNNPENRLAQGHQVQLLDLGIAKPETWERYKPAIERWERLTRDAPEPTEIGTQGKPRLNPRFSEWVMGWYEGWVTDFINPTRKKDPDKVSRSAVLKMIGNGVVPQQAVSALESLMVRFDNERVRDMNTQAIVSQLDAYTGDNIWEDVIYHLDGFDGAATDELNPTTTVWDDNRFVVDGVTYWQTDAGWFSVNAAEFDR